MIRATTSLIFLLLSFVFPLNSSKASPAHTQPHTIFVSILPQAFFAKAIGGEHVTVEVFVRPGASPHTYEPTPKQMALLSRASLFFRTGLPFEDRFIEGLASLHPQLTIKDLRQGIDLRHFGQEEAHHHHHHDHGHHARRVHHHDCVHGSGQPDPHIWLSPVLALKQCETICDAFCALAPNQAEHFMENLKELRTKLVDLHEELSQRLEPYRGSSFFVFHPAFGYFADAYGLKQVAVEHEGKQPSARQLARIIQMAKENDVRVIFVQPQFSKRTAQAVADAIEGSVVTMDPLAENYIDNLRIMGSNLVVALSGERPL